MAGNEPLLNISTLIPEKKQIAIDGELYDLLSFADMGVREQTRFVRIGQEVRALSNMDDMKVEDADILDALVRQFVSMVVSVPDEILAKLSFYHCSAIIQVFTKAAGIELPPPGKSEKQSQPTGAKLSQPSKDSMEEAPTSG